MCTVTSWGHWSCHSPSVSPGSNSLSAPSSCSLLHCDPWLFRWVYYIHPSHSWLTVFTATCVSDTYHRHMFFALWQWSFYVTQCPPHEVEVWQVQRQNSSYGAQLSLGRGRGCNCLPKGCLWHVRSDFCTLLVQPVFRGRGNRPHLWSWSSMSTVKSSHPKPSLEEISKGYNVAQEILKNNTC